MTGITLTLRPAVDRRPIEVAIDRVLVLAKDEAAAEALIDGLQSHGEAFIAYLLGTDVLELDPSETIEIFTEVYCFSAGTQLAAYRRLIDWLGLQESVQAQHRPNRDGFPDVLLTWAVDDHTRERIERRYEFVQTCSGWCVFDTEPIKRRLDR